MLNLAFLSLPDFLEEAGYFVQQSSSPRMLRMSSDLLKTTLLEGSEDNSEEAKLEQCALLVIWQSGGLF